MEEDFQIEEGGEIKKSLFFKIRDYISQNKTEIVLLAVSFFFLICGLYLYLYEKNDSQDIQYEESTSSSVKTVSSQNIFIDLSGAVNKPGVYELKFSSRLKEVIERAGGLSENAETQYFAKNFNLARILVDQEKIYVPSKTDLLDDEVEILSDQINPKYIQEEPSQPELININSASLSELDSLPGVGPVISARIISSRPYSKIEDLKDKKTVNNSLFEKIKMLITVN